MAARASAHGENSGRRCLHRHRLFSLDVTLIEDGNFGLDAPGYLVRYLQIDLLVLGVEDRSREAVKEHLHISDFCFQ